MVDISIILPVYNGEKSITRCINSVLSQTYKNIELIIVDDGSSDNTFDKVKFYLKKDDRVKYKYVNNSGVSHARNVGIDASSGKFLTFIDVDDFVSQDFIEKLVKGIKETGCNISMVNYIEITDNSDIKDYKKYNNVVTIISSQEAIKNILLSVDNFRGFCWNKMFDRKVVKKNGLCFNEKLHYLEDMEFVIRYLKCVDNISVSEEILYYYVKSPTSATSKLSLQTLTIFDSINLIKAYLNKDFEKYANSLYFEMYVVLFNRALKIKDKDFIDEMKKIPISTQEIKDYKRMNDPNFKTKIKVFLTKLFLLLNKGV